MEIQITLNINDIINEVATTTSYTAAKMDDDANAVERITTVEDDNQELRRFFRQSREQLSQAFMRLMKKEIVTDNTYSIILNVSNSFDTALLTAMQLALHQYFLQSITAAWYSYTNKKEAVQYADKATALLEDVKKNAYHKRTPQRPTYN